MSPPRIIRLQLSSRKHLVDAGDSSERGETRCGCQLILALSLLLPQCQGVCSQPGQETSLAKLVQRREELADHSKWPEATSVAEQVVDLAKAKWGPEHRDTAEAMYRLGWLANCARDPNKAEQVWTNTLAIQDKVCGTNSLESARTLGSLGCLYESRNGERRWEPILKRALKIYESRLGSKSLEVAKVTDFLANGYIVWGQIGKARTVALRSAQICEALGRGDTLDGERAFRSLGDISMSVDDFLQAEKYFSRVLASRIKRVGTNTVDAADLMDSLAEVYTAEGRLSQAEALYKTSLTIQERDWAPYERQNLFRVLEGAGQMYLSWGKLDKAEPLLRRALQVLDPGQWSQKSAAVSAMYLLGLTRERRGDFDEARTLFRKTLELQTGSENGGDYLFTQCLGHLALTYFESGRIGEALQLAPELEAAWDRRLRRVFSFTSEKERLAWLKNEDGPFMELWSTLGAPEPLARFILKTKGIILDSLIEERWLTQASEDPALRDLIKELRDARLALGYFASRELGPASRLDASTAAGLKRASTEVDSLEEALAGRVAKLGNVRRAISVTPEEVKAALPPDSVLLEMILYGRLLTVDSWEPDYGVLILVPSGPTKWIPLGPASAIERNINLYKHLVRAPASSGNLPQILASLRREIWEPIEHSLPSGTQRVIVSPDGELNEISFGTLMERDGTLVGERYLVTYVSSGRDLVLKDNSPCETGQLTVLADPDFGASVAKKPAANSNGHEAAYLFYGPDFQPLPGAETEGIWLRDHAEDLGFRNVSLFRGSEATKERLLQVRSPEVLHLATHGFMLPGVDPAADERGAASFPFVEGKPSLGPMLRCGLALAGADCTLKALMDGKMVSPEESGLVTAEEICALDLSGTRLVVLSACDSGSGEVRRGEGILGLRRGFALAGAHNLLLTLWPVQDRITSRFMEDFYVDFRKSGNPSLALARTQQAWLKKLRVEKGPAEACRLAGPFVLSTRGSL